MKILHVGYGGRGGAGRILIDIAKHHSKDFVPSVILLGYSVDGDYLSELEANGIPAFAILKKSRFDLGFLRRLKEKIALVEPQVVLFHSPVAYLWGRLPFITERRKRIIISVEHSSAPDYTKLALLWNLLLSVRTDKIICVSETVKNFLRSIWFPSEKLIVIENGVVVSDLAARNFMKSGTKTISMVARLAPPKDYETLFRAFRLVKRKGYAVLLNVVGDGPQRATLTKMLQNLGIVNYVHFLGERKDVRDVLLRTDLFVLSTRSEGLPISLLEAMEAGCPVIASDIPAISRIIEQGVNGILVPCGDDVALAHAMEVLINDPLTAERLSRNGRLLVERRYNILNTVRKYEKLFIEMVDTHNMHLSV
jgi:glycosyltransferase involved in cell wall biosynthesis